MDTDIYRKFDKYCLLLQSYLSIAAILLLTFGIDAILFSSSALAEPPVYYLNSDQLNDHSLNWSTSDYWSNADGSSPSNIPDNVNGCIFAVGDGYMLRTPEVDTPQTFPYNESGEYNKLYIGYNHNASEFDTGYLNLKCESVKIDNLVLGNGVIDQGLFNSHVTLQGAITVNGNATVMINDESSHEDRLLTIESSIAGSGTLNFKTAFRETRIGFHLASSSNLFSGSVVIDNKSSLSFEAEDVFVNASSITSSGDITIRADQTFNAPLNCTDDSSFTFNGRAYYDYDDKTVKLISGNLVLNEGGRLNNLTYNPPSSVKKETGETDEQGKPITVDVSVPGALIAANGNITNNGNHNLTVNNTSNTTFAGTITSSQGELIKTGDKTLTLTSKENQSINCNVEVSEGTILLNNQITGSDRFGEGKTVTIKAGATLACNAQDSFGNGGAKVTLDIKGGTLQLNSKNNQTFMNKKVILTGGKIKSLVSNCKGIEMKTGTSIHVNASSTPSTISVPIKVREGHLLNIDVDDNARLEFTSSIYKANDTTQGIDKLGKGVVVFSGSFYDPDTSANTYTAKITVLDGVVQLRDEALTTYGQIEVVKSNNDGIITKGTLELFVDRNDLKSMTITNANKIFGTGDIKKTGDGTLKIVSETQGMISAESMFVSSGRLDMQGYFKGLLSVDSGATFSPGNSPGALIIGDQTYGGGFILNEAGAELLMEIRGTDADQNDVLIVDYGNLELHDGSIVYLAATDDCTLQDGEEFTAVLHGANSSTIKNDFISKYVRSSDFNNLEYVQLTSGAYSGKYAITGRRYIDANAVPEPSTWALLILGVAGLFCLKKLQKKKF